MRSVKKDDLLINNRNKQPSVNIYILIEGALSQTRADSDFKLIT